MISELFEMLKLVYINNTVWPVLNYFYSYLQQYCEPLTMYIIRLNAPITKFNRARNIRFRVARARFLAAVVESKYLNAICIIDDYQS